METQTKMKISTETKLRYNEKMVVTDPCYFIRDEDWSTFCDLMFGDWNIKEGTLLYKDATILFTQTAYGDGSYPVFRANKRVGHAGVDAGMICLISESDLNMLAEYGTNDWAEHMFVHVPHTEGVSYVDKKGNIKGDIACYTN